jgi:hypothetical protein
MYLCIAGPNMNITCAIYVIITALSHYHLPQSTILCLCQKTDDWIYRGICWIACWYIVMTTHSTEHQPQYNFIDLPMWIQYTWTKTSSLLAAAGAAVEQSIDNLKVSRPRRQGPTYNLRPYSQWSAHPVQVFVMTVIAMSESHPNRTSEGGPFETDSSLISIDNRCSGCITHIRTNIPGEVVECSRAIKGVGGTKVFRVWTGTITWDWDDDNEQTHHMVIPKSYYVPDGNIRLLSPQHWSQHRTGADKHGGAGETTTATHVTLFWGN